MAEEIKVIRVGDILTNLIDPVSKLSVQYSKTLLWYDSTPMTDAKLDSYGIYVKKGSEYFLKSLGEYGQILQKNTMTEMRNLSGLEILLLRMGYYNSVQLNGYYEKGDTPAPIEYLLSNTTALDDGGSVIAVGGIKLEHEFLGEIEASYFGVSVSVTNNGPAINNIISYATAYPRVGVIKFSEKGTVRTSFTHDFPSNVSVVMVSILNYTGNENVDHFILLGSGGVTRRCEHVINISKAGDRTDFEEEGIKGCVVRNHYGNKITIRFATRFSIGVEFLGDGTGTVFNEVIINQISDCYIGIFLRCINVGWVNDNKFNNGSIIRFSAYSMYTSYGIVADSDYYTIGHNKFDKIGFEGQGTENKTMIPFLARNRFRKNIFIDSRWESATVQPWYNNFFAIENPDNCEENYYGVEVFKIQGLHIGSTNNQVVSKSSIHKGGGGTLYNGRIIYSSGNMSLNVAKTSNNSYRTKNNFFFKTAIDGTISKYYLSNSEGNVIGSDSISLAQGGSINTRISLDGLFRRGIIEVECDDPENLNFFVLPYDSNMNPLTANNMMSGDVTKTSLYGNGYRLTGGLSNIVSFHRTVRYIDVGFYGNDVKSFSVMSTEVSTVSSSLSPLPGSNTGFRSASNVVTENYTVTDNDEVVLVNSSSGAVTITLPGMMMGQQVTVIDVGGSASTNNITVVRSSGNFQNGSSSVVINDNFSSKTFYYYYNTWALLGINNSATIVDITTPNATDEATAIALANANKAKINEVLTKFRDAGLISE